MKADSVEILKRALSREKAARKEAEKILEDKSRELFTISEKLKSTNLKLESLLDEKSSELQGIFENINDAYIVIDLFGDVLKMNNVAEEIFSFNIKNESFNITELIFNLDEEYAYNSFELLKEKGSFNNFTSRIVTKKGEVKWVQINATLIFNKDKIAIAAQGIVRDITKIKDLEIQKQKILNELEKSNNELQEYAHIVSHDLKSPLRSIDALISWIKEDNQNRFDEATTTNFKLIEDTLETMDTLISNILEYSTAGSSIEGSAEVDLQTLVVKLKKVLYVPKHISINILNDLPVVFGDKTKLRQLFQNLISNAVKFIDKEKGIIDIDFKENGTFYEFSIQDNGIGIQEKYHKKIFKIFQTLNNSKESTGIGLSIVKKIVDLYQGDIWIESTPNIGTKFIFTLKK